jgi:arabinofuranan 3-O-arabinosyltransferase
VSVTGLSVGARETLEPLVPEEDATNGPSSDPLSRLWLLVAGGVALAVSLAQSWGLIEDDTKLPVVMAPLSFIEGSLHILNQRVFGGAVDQTGLLFPMSLFFEVTSVLGVPTWVAERFWLALLLTIGFWGIVRVAEALGIGSRSGRVIGAVAYCVAPIVVTFAQTSADLLAVVFLPWMLRPLITGSRGGSPRSAAARSGVAVAFMGGVNAAVTFATFPVALLWFATRQKGQRRRQLFGWWIVAVVLATFWWLVSVALDGKYGFNYLPFTETSIVTTGTASAFEAVRGASYWLDYYALKTPLYPGAWTLVSAPLIILATGAVAALGLAGLCRRIPERLFLISCFAVGVALIAIGYSGPYSGPFSHTTQALLQSSLAPLRNISKFTPDVSLPLALGLAWCISKPIDLSWGRAVLGRVGVRPGATRGFLVGLRAFAVVAVILAAAPFWQQNLYRSGGFDAIPQYWTQAGRWLDQHQGNENAMLVPGSAFASYTWGYPSDEPLQLLSDKSVEWRNLIPLGSSGYIQLLNTVESTLDNGIPTPGLADFLSRGGIKFVIERNDLNLQSGEPPPAQVHQVLSDTPGLKRVASFGPTIGATQAESTALPVYEQPDNGLLHAVEIYEVSPSPSVVQSYPDSDPVVVSGGVSSLLPLAGAGVVSGRASVLSGDPKSVGVDRATKATWAITDGNQRRDTAFGDVTENESYLLGPGQTVRTAQPGVPTSYNVVSGSSHETVSDPIGGDTVSASSFGSSYLNYDPSQGPASAFDGDNSTVWVANAGQDSVGQWVQITFPHKMRVATIILTPLRGGLTQPEITRVRISTDLGSVVRNVPPHVKSVKLSTPAGSTRHMRVTIESVKPGRNVKASGILLGAGIRDIEIPGVTFLPRMKVPTDELSEFKGSDHKSSVVSFSRTIANPNFELGEEATDDPQMARLFDLPRAMQASISGYATASPVGSNLEQLLENLNPPSTPLTVTATASSSLGELPLFRAENTVDSDLNPWIAGLTDGNPSLVLSWKEPEVVSELTLKLSLLASAPREISVTGTSGPAQIVAVPPNGGVIHFNPIETNALKIRFLRVKHKVAATPGGVEFKVPVGLAEISLPGLIEPQPLPASRTFLVACGQGPPLIIDGTTIQTGVVGTVGDLLNFRPVTVVPCEPNGGVTLAPGNHTFHTVDDASAFQLMSLVLKAPTAQNTVPSTRPVSVKQWGSDAATVSIGAGSSSIVAVAQNYNSGWRATMGTESLKPIRVDGWEQGFIVPAGRGGTIDMHVAPDTTFRLALLFGAIFLVILAALALFPGRRRDYPAVWSRPVPVGWLLAIGVFAILAAIGGLLALVAVPMLYIARRWGAGWMAAIAVVAFGVAGIAAAMQPASVDHAGAGAFGGTAQVATVVAIAAVLASLGARDPSQRRSGATADGAPRPDSTSEIPEAL